MLIRAYRMRGHLHANLDPLGLGRRAERGGARSALLRLQRCRSRPPDLPRPCARARVRHLARDHRHPAAHLLPDARRRVHAHLGPGAEGLDPGAHRGPDKEISFTREGKRAILNKLVEAEGFENFCDVKFTGTKRFGLDGGESMIPALEQIIKRGGALGVKDIASAWRIAAGSTCSPRSWASRTARSSTSSRAARRTPTTSRARAT